MMASLTSACVARSRVVVPRNPFFANKSIAAARISCLRSCFISKYLLTVTMSSRQEKFRPPEGVLLAGRIGDWRVVDQLDQQAIGIVEIERSGPVSMRLGLGGQLDAVGANSSSPVIDVPRLSN